MSHPDMVRRTARTDPSRACVIEGDRRLDFIDVDQRADLLADALVSSGHGAGNRVAVLAQNELEYLEIVIGCQRAGATLVPLNTRFAPPELQAVVADSSASLLIHGPGFADVAPGLGTPRVWHLGQDGAGESYDDVLRASDAVVRTIADPDALATLLYTSGTTGRSKGAMISNRAQLARSLALGNELQMSPSSIFLQMLPMFHLAQQFSCAYALAGGTNIMMATLDPGLALREIGKHGVTDTLLVPTILKMLLDHPEFAATDRSTLNQMLYGGAPIDPTLLSRALDGFNCGFFQMYGMTETGPATLLRPADHDPSRPETLRSAGSDIVTYELATVDDLGQPCASDVRGEIVIRGPGVMDGYWGQPEDSAHTLRGGWMHTGDAGHLDEHGMLFVTDRVKDMIVTGGENVSPVEVEHALLAHPDVAECAVIGLPDDHYGERVHAVVIRAAGSDVDESALQAHVRAAIAGYKVPRSWSFTDELPRTATGKVRKNILRETVAVVA